jgi:NAD(P)-dependent dehydrogenase (short-subunit alcohol dehydrogenase family)
MGIDDFQGKNAVVVGGGSGIGRGIALGLAAEGARILVADIDLGSANAVRAEIEARGGKALAAQVDATNADSLAKLANQTSSELGKLHVLIHMIGVISDSAVSDSSDDTWAWATEFNLTAVVRSVRAFLPLLRAHDEGRHIVVTASTAGLMSIPPEKAGGLNIGVYTVMKHAMAAYGEMLRSELAPEGINVSTLCPGIVRTNLDETSAKNRPERFGGPMGHPKELTITTRMDPEACGPIVARGIKANRRYIFTHPAMLEVVQDYKFKPILEDFAFYSATADS